MGYESTNGLRDDGRHRIGRGWGIRVRIGKSGAGVDPLVRDTSLPTTFVMSSREELGELWMAEMGNQNKAIGGCRDRTVPSPWS